MKTIGPTIRSTALETSGRKTMVLYPALAAAFCLAVFLIVAIPGNPFDIVLSVDGYLIFHLITEFSSIVVSFAIFSIGWYGYKQQPDVRNLAIAVTFLGVGLLDFVHALSYNGMPDFLSTNTIDKAAIYWLAARLVGAIGLLAIPLIPDTTRRTRSLPYLLVLLAVAAVAGLVLLESYVPSIFPAAFVPGEGLTPFKDYTEYLIMALSGATIVLLWSRPVFGIRFTSILQAGLVFIIFSELAFTFYASAYDIFNMLGHFFKVIAYFLILRAIFVSSLQQPYQELRSARNQLERSFDDIGKALSSGLELDQMLDLIVRLTSGMLQTPYVVLALSDNSEPRDLTIHAFCGFDEMPSQSMPRDAAVEKVLMDAKPFRVSLKEVEPAISFKDASGAAFRTLLAAPILRDDEAIGVIEAFSPTADAFSDFSTRQLAAFARHASTAIENAHIFEEEKMGKARIQGYANQLSILHKIGLTLNEETDVSKLLNTILSGAASLTSAGIGLLALSSGDKVEIAATYYAPWAGQACEIEGDLFALHRRVSRLTADKPRGVVRINYADDSGPEDLPKGHVELENILLAGLRDMRGRIKGHILLGNKPTGDGFSQDDEEVISLLAAQGLVALTSAESFEAEHTVAETLQDSLLPEIPEREGLDVGLLYESSSRQARVGGDFYDFIELDDSHTALAIGDVCGKGLDAATYTAMIKYTLQAYLYEGLTPGECLTRLNSMVNLHVAPEKFVTVCVCVIDDMKKSLSIASAGHPPPIMAGKDEVSPLPVNPMVPLGVIEGQSYPSEVVSLQGIDTLLFYTDGLTEARPDGGVQFGQGGITKVVRENRGLFAQQLTRAVVDAAISHSRDSLRDDIAIMVVHFLQQPGIKE